MRSPANVLIMKTVIGNHATRALLSGMCKHCTVDDANRLEVAIEMLIGEREEACTFCRAAEKVLTGVISAGAGAFGVERDEILAALQDPYWRKGLSNVVKGIAIFGVRRPFVPGAPFQVVWDVTHSCNLRCKHCYASAGKADRDELSTQMALDLIDRLAAWGVPIIAFSGGEPLMRPDILELMARAHEKGIYVALATNGTLITKEKAAEIKRAGAEYLQISLDGADAVTHDHFRGVDGAFERTLDGIRNAVAEEFFVSISTTATQANKGQIPAIIDLGDRLGVNWIMVYNFVPAGRGQGIRDADLSPDEREDLLKVLYEKNSGSKCQVLTTAPQFARVALQQCQGDSFLVPTHFYNLGVDKQLVNLTEFIGGCGAGRFYLAIRANGNIDPCVFFPRTVGNALTSDLEKLWKTDRLLNDLRDKDMLKGNCGTCDYRYQCGGCRARAYGYLDDPIAPDPGCIRNVSVYQTLLNGGKH